MFRSCPVSFGTNVSKFQHEIWLYLSGEDLENEIVIRTDALCMLYVVFPNLSF